MIFASKTPRDLTSKAAAKLCARCEAEFQEQGLYSEDEHRDYHQPPQHNEPNPILVEVRRDFPKEDESYDWWAWAITSAPDPSWTDAHIDHARRVLVRLAVFEVAVSA